jgi:Family of unknown function (DUF6535)
LIPFNFILFCGTVGNPDVPPAPNQAAQKQPPQGQSNFSDGSGHIFNMYNKMAEEEDNKMADRWQKDADGILIFVSAHTSFHIASLRDT